MLAASFLTNDLCLAADGAQMSENSSSDPSLLEESGIIRYSNISLGSEFGFSRRGADRMLTLRMTDVRKQTTEATTGDGDPFIPQASPVKPRKNDLMSLIPLDYNSKDKAL